MSKAVNTYLAGSLGQMLIACILVTILKVCGMEYGYNSIIGMIAIAIGGLSTAIWGSIVSIKYLDRTFKEILVDFIDIRKCKNGIIWLVIFLFLDFLYVIFGGKFVVESWFSPIMLFVCAILFGGIEEIGWRYTFQPMLEEKCSYVVASVITCIMWGIWHFMYFYVDGSISTVDPLSFLLGLLTSCFIFSALYKKTGSLCMCVVAHALVNVFMQISKGGNANILLGSQIIIIVVARIIANQDSRNATL